MNTDKNLPNTHCALTSGLLKVGDKWSMLVLRDIASGISRFDQIRSSLGIAPNILTQRLKALTDAGVLERRRYNERPPRDEFVLTDAGRDFLPVLYVIAEWGRRHNGGVNLSRLTDPQTGALVEPMVVDRITGDSLESRALRIVLPDDLKG